MFRVLRTPAHVKTSTSPGSAAGGGAGQIRWRLWLWPVLVLDGLAVALLAWVWSVERDQRQDQVVATMAVTGATAILLVLWTLSWLLLLSRMRWRARLAGSAAIVTGLALAPAVLEIRGVSGDVMPVLGWRWSGEAAAATEGPAAARRSAPVTASAHDFPQFQGPSRDGRVPGVRLTRDWSAPPRVRWRRPVGAGWSGFAVAGAYAVTQEQRGEDELVTCYDRLTGELLWAHADRTRWDDPLGGPGPRATPAIHGGRVYALGASGVLNALDLGSGALLWSRNVLVDAAASPPAYGVSASPLVLDGYVVAAVGGTEGQALVGYDAETGVRRWSGGSGGPAYGSPRQAVLAGAPQILVLNSGAVAAHDPGNGRVLWEFAWPSGTEMTFTPLVLPGDRVFVSTGYGVGGKLLQVRSGGEGAVVDLLWESRGLKSKFSNVVYHDGFLYGLDDGILVCLDPATGERRWKEGRHGHGQLLLVDDLLLVLGESGEVALVEARPAARRELGSFTALAGKTWNPPALAGSELFVRNDREAACYELPLAGAR